MKTPPRGRPRLTSGLSSKSIRSRQPKITDSFQNSPVFLSTHDLAGIIQSINDAACRALGYTERDLVGTSVRDLLAPERRVEFDKYLATIRRSGSATGVMTVVTSAGEKRSWHYQNLRSPETGSPPFVQSTAIDVTEVLLAELSAIDELRESEERYRLLFERNVAGIYRTTLDGTILDCNEAFAKILGYSSREQVLSRNARDLYVYDTDRQAFVAELLEKRRLESRETCLRGRDGSDVWVVESVTFVDPDGDRPAILEGSILDISDRRRAEEAIRQSESRYRFLFEGNPLPMWIYEVATLKFIDVNEAALRHYGYSRSEFLSMRLPDIRPPEDREDLLRKVAETAKTPQPFTPSRHLRKDGAILHVEVSAVDVPGGPVRRRMALARDVTERKAAEDALIESERKYRHIFSLAPVGIYQITEDGKILTANPAFARILGYDGPEELIANHTAADLYFRREERDDAIREFVGTASPKKSVERLLKGKAGNGVWAQVTAQPIRNENGEIEYLEGFLFDITERKLIDEQQQRLQEAVLETARQWRDTFDAIETPVFVVDGDAVIKRLNRNAVELTGRTYVDVLGSKLDEIGTGNFWTSAAALARDRAQRTPKAGILCRDDLAQKDWEISISGLETFEPQGSPMSILIARDITAIVKLQESAHRAESMSSMGSLVAGVAHEVRNPLFAISATLDAFELRFKDRDEHKKYARAFRTQLDRMNSLMRDLLDYGKPATLEFRFVSPAELVTDAFRGCTDLAAQKNISVQIQIPDDLPPIPVDRARIVQVFVNLIENAIQHSPDGSSVAVRAETWTPGGLAGIRFIVEDRGPGFQQADLPMLFDPFFTRRQGGTGLGLAIVRKIIDEHGGSITPANLAEGGAVMSVWLPRELPAETRGEPRPEGRDR